jgi:spore germination protein GerM
MRGRTGSHRRTGVIVIAFVVFAVIIGVMIQRKYAERNRKPVAPPHAQQAPTVVVTLYFVEPDGDGLQSEGRTIDACGDPAACIDALIGELVAGPVGDLETALPPTLQLLGVKFDKDAAVLDFSRDLIDGVPAGSSAEMGEVYSIVNTVCANLPQVKRVGFLVDGKPVETLKGHLDLRELLAPDYSLETKEPAAPAGTTNEKGGKR